MRFRLLQARLPDNPVRAEERASFAGRLEVPIDEVIPFDLTSEPIDAAAITRDVDVVLVGGAGMFSVGDDIDWMHRFHDALAAIVDDGFPMFASCFGYQGLIVAMGGRVAPDEDSAEVGTFEASLLDAAREDPLFRELPDRFTVQQGHKERALEMPDGVTELARSERCPHQAFRVPGKPIYATQFHAELTGEENRQRFQRYLRMYKSAFGASQAQKMLDQFRDSWESNALLKRFVTRLQAGDLG